MQLIGEGGCEAEESHLAAFTRAMVAQGNPQAKLPQLIQYKTFNEQRQEPQSRQTPS
jgi:hypothetical protein